MTQSLQPNTLTTNEAEGWDEKIPLRLSIKLSDRQRKYLEELAEGGGVSMASVARFLIDQGIQAMEWR